jgi:hypothetical protein
MDDDCAFVKAKPEGFYDIVSTRDTIEGGIEVIPADKVRRLVEVLRFYANGAGVQVVDEGRNYNSHYVAYENHFDLKDTNHFDKPIGEYAKQVLKELGEL